MPRYDACLNRILARAPGCPEEVAINALRDTCIDWCSRTYMLTTGMDVTSVAAAVNLAGGMDVVDVIDAQIGGNPVPVYPMNDPRVSEATAGNPCIVFAALDTLTITPAPASPVTANLLVVLRPGFDSDEFPDLMWHEHRDTLIRGASARVLMDEGVPWAKPQLASVLAAAYDADVTKWAALYGRNRLTIARRLRVKPA